MTVTLSKPGHRVLDTQRDFAGPTNTPPAIEPPTPKEVAPAGPDHPPTKAESPPNPLTSVGPILADPLLGLFADVVDDLESVRIANANRLRQLCDDGEHGHGMSVDHPEVKRLAELLDGLEKAEHQAVLAMRRAMRAHPLGTWVKSTKGVGEKQAARLLAAIRDPYWNDLHQRPRLVSELWAYCGMHTVSHPGGQSPSDAHPASAARVAPTHQRGRRSNWNSLARQRVWLIAESCIKCTDSPYRDVYDAGRLRYADAVHSAPCVRCGPAGTPAAAGTPLSLGHQHARAMRLMCKEILRDLWRESARLHSDIEATS